MSRISPLKKSYIHNAENIIINNNPRIKLSSIKKNVYDRNQENDLDRSRNHGVNSQLKMTPETKPFRHQDVITTKHKERIVQNFENKIEQILKHNSQLLNENTTLGEIINERNRRIEMLEKRLEQHMNDQISNLNMIEIQKNRLISQVEQRYRQKQNQITRLLQQISRMHDQIQMIENEKNKELSTLKEMMIRDSHHQIEALKKSQLGNSQLYQLQIKKLKEIIQAKNYEIQSYQHTNKISSSKLEQQIANLTSQLKHYKKISELEKEQSKNHYENTINTLIKQNRKNIELQTGTLETAIKKLKKELGDKIIENERLNIKIMKSGDQNNMEYQFLKQEKHKAQQKMMALEIKTKEDLKDEKQRLNKLSSDQMVSVQNTHKNFQLALESENAKLLELVIAKSEEICRLHEQIELLRESNQRQNTRCEKLIEDFKNKLIIMQADTQEEIQTLKIKMAHLHSGDVQTIKRYYEGQIQALAQQIQVQNKIVDENRKKLHEELEAKTELRKRYEIELSAEKTRVKELELKLMMTAANMKQDIASIGTQMQMNSTSAINEVQIKQRENILQEDEKKKLQQMIANKDIQIEQLEQQIVRLKTDFEKDAANRTKDFNQLKLTLADVDTSHNKEREYYENELRKKETLLKQQKQSMEQELSDIKTITYQDLKNQISQLQKQTLKLTKQIEAKEREKAMLSKQLAVQKSVVQKVKIQSSVMIENEKENGQYLKAKNINELKGHYQDIIKSKNEQLEELKRRLSEKEHDVREFLIKHQNLQKKLNIMLENSQKLRQFQNKIMNLGGDNNLLKNMSELLKHRSK